MTYGELGLYLVATFGFLVGWESRRLWTQIWPYILFWWNNRGPDYGKLPPKEEKPVRALATEYNQVPLRKRVANEKDKGLN